jgi:hypothetical protein
VSVSAGAKEKDLHFRSPLSLSLCSPSTRRLKERVSASVGAKKKGKDFYSRSPLSALTLTLSPYFIFNPNKGLTKDNRRIIIS